MGTAHLWLVLIPVIALGASDSRRGRVDAEDAPKPAGRVPRCIVVGRIVDGSENGVPDAQVSWIADSPAGDLSTGAAVRTDDTGRFRLELDGPANDVVRGLLHATHRDDSATIEPIVLGARDREKDVGSLELIPARPLKLSVSRGGASAREARIWLWAGGNEAVFVGTATTDSEGRAEFPPLPALLLNLYAWAPDGSGGEAGLEFVPQSAQARVRVELGASRTVDVLVTTDETPARPIVGASVFRRYVIALGSCVATEVAADAPNRISPTAADGHTQVDALPTDRSVTIEARIPGRPRGRVECKPGETSATIVIPKPTTILVQDGELPRPPDGTKLVVWGRKLRTPIEGWIEKGSIAVPLVDNEVGPGLAIAPDGSLAPLDRLKPTSFFRPRSLSVRILEKSGLGVAGTWVSLSSSPYVEGPLEVPVATDGEGRVRFEGLAPTKHFIYAFPNAQFPHGHRVDEVDLRPGSATREVVVGTEGSLVAFVTMDGRPAVPERFRWTIPDGILVDSTVDRAKGTVRIRVRSERGMSDSASIEFGGKDVRPRTVAFAWPAPGAATSIEVPLFTSPEVIVDVRADPDSDVQVDVEGWEVSPWDTKPWERGQWQRHGGPYQAGRIRTDLPQGHYRLRDRTTGIVSAPFDVPERGAKVVATLDLRGLVTIRGHVECPDPTDAKSVELVLDGEGIDSQRARFPYGTSNGMDYDGRSFALRVPAGRRVTISPWHWKHQPAREGGMVTLSGPRDDVVLKMGAGATLVATLEDPDGRPVSAAELKHVWIAAIPAAHPSWRPETGLVTPVSGRPGTVSASGLPFGTLDLWIQVEGFAARRLERLTLASDKTDLGEVRLSRGSKVLLRRIGKDGVVAPVGPRFDSWAFATFGPQQVRFLEPGRTDHVYTGLCAGRWRVEVWPSESSHQVQHAIEFDVDGEHDKTLDMKIDEVPASTPR